MKVKDFEITGYAPQAKRRTVADTNFSGTHEEMLARVAELRRQGWRNVKYACITNRMRNLRESEEKESPPNRLALTDQAAVA